MTEARKDENGVSTLIITSNADGSTPMLVQVDSTAHSILIEDNTTGSDLSGDIASRDKNFIPVLMGVSSTDGITPTAIYGDPATGKILINSN